MGGAPRGRARSAPTLSLLRPDAGWVRHGPALLEPHRSGQSCRLTLPVALPFLGDQLVLGAVNVCFPISYIFGDVLTEVYGYARARKVIWAGFAAMIFATVMSEVVIQLPPNGAEPFNAIIQPALE